MGFNKEENNCELRIVFEKHSTWLPLRIEVKVRRFLPQSSNCKDNNEGYCEECTSLNDRKTQGQMNVCVQNKTLWEYNSEPLIIWIFSSHLVGWGIPVLSTVNSQFVSPGQGQHGYVEAISECSLGYNHRTSDHKVSLNGKHMLLTLPTHDGDWLR